MEKLKKQEIIAFPSDKCTAIALGGGSGSATGSPMTTHTADCAECDWRVNKVPARDWPEGSMRPVWLITSPYPRQVREDRGYTWKKENLEDMPQKSLWEQQEDAYIIGYIPQVAHTYALIEGMYGIMNEHQVAIGESTCASKLYAAPVSDGGKALLEISELSQIALERSKTAREAILVMGDLAETYGYYSAEWNVNKYGESYAMGEGGEALTVVDANEAWVFHIIPDDTGASAIWVAQRVPDGHIAAVANAFVIREVVPEHPDFMYSTNLFSIAEKKGWYDPTKGPFNFIKAYAPTRFHPNYSNNRVWRVLSLAAPDLNLPLETNAYADDYPFSVPVTREQGPFSAQDLMWMQRDHFENTPINTAMGLAGGPYGDPNRFDLWSNGNMTVWEANEGEFPRTISLFRTSYAIVAEPRKSLPRELGARVWLAEHQPDTAAFTPLYVQSEELPKSWISGTMQKYDSSKAWWNFCAVGNYASRFYSFAIQPIRDLQHELEATLLTRSAALEASLLSDAKSAAGRARVVSELTQFTVNSGEMITSRWRDLFPYMLTTYRDGFIVGGQSDATVQITRMFYPRWWLETVGFFNHPPNREGILFASNPLLDGSAHPTNGLVLLFVAVMFFATGLWMGRRANKASPLELRKQVYTPIPDGADV